MYSRGAFSQAGGELVGMIVGEVHPLSAVEGETGCVLEETQQDTRAFYIISLGREGGRGRGGGGGGY